MKVYAKPALNADPKAVTNISFSHSGSIMFYLSISLWPRTAVSFAFSVHKPHGMHDGIALLQTQWLAASINKLNIREEAEPLLGICARKPYLSFRLSSTASAANAVNVVF